MTAAARPSAPPAVPVLIVHGGAGPRREPADADADAELRRALARAVDAGWAQLAAGAGAEAACVAAVCLLEDDPRFNAGIGSALAADGGVWCDAGELAAATSTGGYAGKPTARIGDSAILGAGTWADRRTCAISATGDGKAFMRVLFAHEVHARMLHGGEDLAAAALAALAAVHDAGGRGGAICVGADGTIAIPVSSEAMSRAWRRGGEGTQTALGGA